MKRLSIEERAIQVAQYIIETEDTSLLEISNIEDVQ